MREVLLSESTLWLILEAFIFGAGIFLLVTMFSKKPLKKLSARLAQEGMTLEEFDQELASPSFTTGNVYVSDKHVVTGSSNPTIMKIEDVVWMYPNTFYSSNGAANHSADFCTRYRGFYRFRTKSKEESELLCRAVHEKQPNALNGYVIEYKDMYYNRFDELIDQVYNRNQETTASETAPEKIPDTLPETVSQIPVELPSSSDNGMNTPDNNVLQ